jgi:hypothetical protein
MHVAFEPFVIPGLIIIAGSDSGHDLFVEHFMSLHQQNSRR